MNRIGYRKGGDPGEMIRVASPLTFGYQLYGMPDAPGWIARNILNNGNPTPSCSRRRRPNIFGKVILSRGARAQGHTTSPMDYHFWFASKYGYAAIKCEQQGDGEPTRSTRPALSRQVGPYWVATSGRHTVYFAAKRSIRYRSDRRLYIQRDREAKRYPGSSHIPPRSSPPQRFTITSATS